MLAATLSEASFDAAKLPAWSASVIDGVIKGLIALACVALRARRPRARTRFPHIKSHSLFSATSHFHPQAAIQVHRCVSALPIGSPPAVRPPDLREPPAVTCVIMQRSGGVLHSAAGARWDAKMDGMCVKVAGA